MPGILARCRPGYLSKASADPQAFVSLLILLPAIIVVGQIDHKGRDMTNKQAASRIAGVLLATLMLAGPAMAHEEDPPTPGARWDLSLDMPVWPALVDLQPVAGGSFDDLGFGIGASFHWPVRQLASSDLLLGFDINIAATDSNIRGSYATLLARQLYLGASLKWLFGTGRNKSLDAGIGYHEVDMAQVDAEWYGTWEYEHWSSSKPSAFIGATWDIGAGRPHKKSGLFVGFRAYFADFGRVYDEDFAPPRPTLGPDAGTLNGPLYFLRIGYSAR
jgi:hypothetical protein